MPYMCRLSESGKSGAVVYTPNPANSVAGTCHQHKFTVQDCVCHITRTKKDENTRMMF